MTNNNGVQQINTSESSSVAVSNGTGNGLLSGGTGGMTTYQLAPTTITEIMIDMDLAAFNVEGKKIKASEIIVRLQKLEEMVGVLAENPSVHPSLKAAYDKYKTLETLIGEKKDG